MTTGVHVDVILTCFFSCKDRASERYRPRQRKKKDQTPLPIWRPEAYFKYPDGGDLETEEILRLLELFRSCLLGKRAVQGVVKRTKDNIHKFQKDTYQLGILTLNLGHINRVPYIGGCSKFPKWIRTDINHRALPHLVFRNAAHIVCLCEASDEYGGIAVHREIAKEYGMIGMVVHPAIQSQSLAIFIRGAHDVGTFIELLGHHQIETGNKSSPFWILHGAIFRLCHGQNTSGEFVDSQQVFVFRNRISRKTPSPWFINTTAHWLQR